MSNILAQADTPKAGTGVIDLFKPAVQQGLPFSGGSQAAGTAQFGVFLGRVLQALMAIGVLSVLIFLVWGAIEWITAGGEKGKIEAARNKITGAVIGIIVLASSVAIFSLVQNFFGVHILTFPGQSGGSATSTGIKCDDWANPGETHCNVDDCHQYFCQPDGKWKESGTGGVCAFQPKCR